MRKNTNDYWRECISSAFGDVGIVATDEQIAEVADAVEGAHENYGMAFYQPSFSEHPVHEELRKAKEDLRKERDKVHCEVCRGTGSTHTYGGTFMSTSQCYKCHGEGRHAP